MSGTTERLDEFRDIAGRYDAFFLDQFGVVHDGSSAYPGAAEAVTALASLGKPVLFVTNSGRPAAFNEARLAEFGVARHSYLACITSGDVAIALVEDGTIAVPQGRRTRCLTLSSPGDAHLSERLDCIAVNDAEDADLIVIAGSQADRISMDAYAERMGPAAKRGVPAICTNPDHQMLTPSGLAPGAGAIADLYGELGGHVTFVGKPHGEIYEAAYSHLQAIEKTRILCVGDSISHDIVGAQGFGAAKALVHTGIQAGSNAERRAAKLRETGVTIDHHLPCLRWAR
ncbi:HAD-superfamily class IIA hydrolase, TIGR01459 [Fulvimarina manganoxydans]|uniref:HAD-superfamily class IIA hydrolase, TIGR01459 n=1 Tax=Fulvimarina manganoxydans TaxID=937218 RepID=A0A1W2DLZ4_9HYPH|nr:TIGR01459 family HAD-type hydrolase [Fulvimarina manganoxydans]SMC98564.1 HAD-superfamily class IIA hydrolase, TIGR01459 [Fulvimarina manganoxydans]